ncbi:hypothetical protein [[Clostridium] hylemonae]|uniref:hypothetical protein n=1 Tax=[Clostridium] hylemonae TaxID=89153 RepID=UPI001105F000|nr:hypothetical protein [[Clostridium] hylemonae]
MKIILTNIPNYSVSDENCENLYYRAIDNKADAVLIGPSSMKTGERFKGRGVKTGVSISYPSGAAFPDLKAQEILDCEKLSGVADMYFVTAAAGYYMSGHEDNLREEMRLCVKAAKKPVYFITEAAEMTDECLEKMCRIACEEHVKGIVTSTAFMPYDIKRAGAADVSRLKAYGAGQLETVAFGPFCAGEDVEEIQKAGADMMILNESCEIGNV